MYHLIRGITYWLAVIPFLMRLLLRVAWMLQAQHPCQQLDWLKTLLIVLAAGVLTVLVVFLDLFWGFHAFVFTSVTLALLTWRYLPVPDYMSGNRTCTFGSGNKTDFANIYKSHPSDVSPVTYRPVASTAKKTSAFDGLVDRLAC
eukprot:s210_g2.t1